jgi:hypothetical protein
MHSSLIRKGLVLTVVLSAGAGSAFATSSRVDALSGNVGMLDDTDFQTFASETDEAGANVWLNNNGGAISGAVSWDGTAVAVDASGDSFSATWYNADGDTGYSAGVATDGSDVALSGSYSTADGDDNRAFFGGLSMVGDVMGVSAGGTCRTLTDDAVTQYGGLVTYNDDVVGAQAVYNTGARFGTDSSSAALTYGAGLNVSDATGDMGLSVSVGNLSLAGEFMFNDWVGIRGSVTTGASYDVLGDGGLSGSSGSAFGATFHAEGADIDLVVAPEQLTGGPYFLTGNAVGSIATMSARFDI